MGSNNGQIEKSKGEIKQILERVRGAIRMRVHPRDQSQLLDAVDRIQDAILNGADASLVGTDMVRGKDATRKVLRSRPVDMVQILNEFDGLEQEVTKLLQLLNK